MAKEQFTDYQGIRRWLDDGSRVTTTRPSDSFFRILDRDGNEIDRTTDYELARDIAKHYGARVR